MLIFLLVRHSQIIRRRKRTVIHFFLLTSYIIHFSRQYVTTLLNDPSSACVDERRYFFNAGAIVSGRKVTGLEGRTECEPSLHMSYRWIHNNGWWSGIVIPMRAEGQEGLIRWCGQNLFKLMSQNKPAFLRPTVLLSCLSLLPSPFQFPSLSLWSHV